MSVPVPPPEDPFWGPEAWALAGTFLTVLATLAGAWVGARWQHKTTVKSLQHAATEGDKQRKHADQTSMRQEARQEAERLWNERKMAHTACLTALSNLSEWRPGDERSAASVRADAIAATSLVRLLASQGSGDAAHEARELITDAVQRRRRSLPVEDDMVMELRAGFDRYIASARDELHSRPEGGSDDAPASGTAGRS